MEVAGMTLIVIGAGILLYVLIGAVVIHFAAKLSGVKNAPFRQAVKACIATIILSIIISLVFSLLPVIGTITGFLISLFLTLLIYKSIYETGWGRAFLIWIMQWVVLIIFGLIIASITGLSLL